MVEARLGRLFDTIRRKFRPQEVSVSDFFKNTTPIKGAKVALHGYAKLVDRGQIEIIPGIWQGMPEVRQRVKWDIHEQPYAQSPKIVTSGKVVLSGDVSTFDDFREVRVVGKVAVSSNQQTPFVKVTQIEKVQLAG